MACHVSIVLGALLLFAMEYEVSAQYASVVECLPATTVTVTRPVIKAEGQYILPAIIQPIIPSSYAPDPYSNYRNNPAPIPPYPIIIKDNSDILPHLLYFLIFALQNKRSNSNINSQYCGCNSCNCCRSCNCGCCCNNNNSYNNNNNNNDFQNNKINDVPTYVPVPIAIPVFTGPDGCSLLDAFSGLGDEIVIQGPPGQPNGGKEPNEINLIIRADR